VSVSLLLFGPLGWPELLIIAFVLLLLFGTRLPDVMRNLGRGVTNFKKGLQEGKDGEGQDGPSKGSGA
jgi:sec-independent protein translocase protein TatA